MYARAGRSAGEAGAYTMPTMLGGLLLTRLRRVARRGLSLRVRFSSDGFLRGQSLVRLGDAV